MPRLIYLLNNKYVEIQAQMWKQIQTKPTEKAQIRAK